MFSIGSLCHQALSISIIGSSIHNTVTKIRLEILEFTVSLKVVGRDETSRLTGGLVSQVQFQLDLKSDFYLSGKTFIPQKRKHAWN